VGARHAPRFLKNNERSKFPAPNAYFKSRGKTAKSARFPFDAKSNRFPARKIEHLPTIGTYTVTEDFGRHVEKWRRAPDEMKYKKSL